MDAAHWAHQSRRPGGHFAGIQFFDDKIDTGKGRWLVGCDGGRSTVPKGCVASPELM